MKLLLSLLFSILFVNCSTTDERVNITSGLDNVYISSGVEQYFLGNLPHWINFSSWAKCRRNESIRYMNYEILKKSYALTYDQMVHMQHMWNRKLYAYKRSGGQGNLPLKDESFVFNNVYAQVIGGSYVFSAPKFNQVSLVWIDPFIENKKKLKQILRSDDVLSGHPVIISHCLSSYAAESLLQELELEDLGIKIIPAEMFSLFDKNIQMGYEFQIDVSQIMKKKKIILYSSEETPYIMGANKFKKVN